VNEQHISTVEEMEPKSALLGHSTIKPRDPLVHSAILDERKRQREASDKNYTRMQSDVELKLEDLARLRSDTKRGAILNLNDTPGFNNKNLRLDPHVAAEERFYRILVTQKPGYDWQTITLGGVGSSFGELGILNNKPRGATVIAKTKVVCIFILSQDYQKILASVEKANQEKKIEFIHRQVLGNSVSQTLASYIAWTFTEVTLPKGSRVYEIGDTSDCVYFIVKGRVMLSLNMHIDKDMEIKHMKKMTMKSITVNMFEINNGDCFGLEEFLIAKKRFYRAQVSSKKCTMYYSTYTNFARSLKELPQLFNMIIKPVNDRQKRSRDRLKINFAIHTDGLSLRTSDTYMGKAGFGGFGDTKCSKDMIKRSFKGMGLTQPHNWAAGHGQERSKREPIGKDVLQHHLSPVNEKLADISFRSSAKGEITSPLRKDKSKMGV
jgi:CRP-like cAMP-binding protein